MMIPRAKPATSTPVAAKADKYKTLKLEDFIKDRDYTGACTVLKWNRNSGEASKDLLEWLAYSSFHLGNYKDAQDVLQELTANPDKYEENKDYHTYVACCMFYQGMYQEAEVEAQKGTSSQLQNRLLFHIAHKSNDESKLMHFHQKLQDNIEDQEAIDVYKRILMDSREYLALNVYIALCYYKLDYYDISQEVLNVYLQANPKSAISINLKACNHFRLYNGKAAEQELKQLQDLISSSPSNFGNELMQHNMVVFRNGENALQVLPPLLYIIPEARLNLVIYYLRNDEVQEAYNLIKDVDPSTPQEYTLKGVVNATYGQLHESREHIKMAQQYFQLVGASASECDTIAGRQCMASCFFLLRNFEDVMIYLNSIKGYFENDDDFHWNYGVAKACNSDFREGEASLLAIQNEKYKAEYCYLSWLARCYIMNGKARLAWELYLKMETSSESFNLLQLIANDCYKTGAFFYSAKAFDVLERLDPNPEYWDGKRGACVGVFRQVVAGQEPKDILRDVINMLRNTNNPQVDVIIRIIKKWSKDNDMGH
ncbi:hypothetical protein PROFUN_03674 [Planoprotostelium fungivorum]|uniref:Tetratricopeptide repeat protein 26 n=1 Tax=Planoprotostelium fungivorum TaxID=1890364 RepID=A0A2P6NSK5_9EUKA|nr:hypothetical protein PROFUN_03674 [Planoprotostelium fungivorum]